MTRNHVRIIGGRWRRRVITFPGADGLRPTPDRVRETLFNWLGQDLKGKICLDLFAGSGVLGLEALSRGAKAVLMVENNPRVLQALRANAAGLGAQDLELNAADGVQFLRQERRLFDVIFLDPPYGKGYLPRLLPLALLRLAPQGVAYVEGEQTLEPGPEWRIWRSGRAGQAHFHLLKRALC